MGALESVDISLVQDRDEEIKEMKDYLSNQTLQNYQTKRDKIMKYSSQYVLENDVLHHKETPKIFGNDQRMRKQLVVPLEERGKLLQHCHNELGRAGFLRTFSRLREQYFWITMKT